MRQELALDKPNRSYKIEFVKLNNQIRIQYTCTATYAMERGVTLRMPKIDATFARVGAKVFLARLTTGTWSVLFSSSFAAELGEVNINWYA